MDFFSSIYTRFLPWRHNPLLPTKLRDATATFHSWHEFNESVDQWTSIPIPKTYRGPTKREIQQQQQQQSIQDQKFVLATWNVNAAAELPAERMSAIVSHITNSAPAVDIIFLQEVSKQALDSLLSDPQIRRCWYSSEADVANWRGLPFATMTLLSKRRFNHANGLLGPVWRYEYPSRFDRDALCCDVFLPLPAKTPTGKADYVRARLVNVHLDSLPLQPSRRPRQLSIVASVIRSANRGLVAGDFNPVLPEDATLISENRLIDAWHELHPGEPGFTWGLDGNQRSGACRSDKVAVVGLRPLHIEVMHPGVIDLSSDNQDIKEAENVRDEAGLSEESDPTVPWSDHSGLKCSLELVGE
ncbi:hypothetical protein QQS21_007197 [Conoideocrella luteorostrata]|uniref:Endonuclease/exonuclease/phosphatase domain-containing protein n=1 Tax=Conoideocrella luteorostrata TaxID=1105319 RepID=A0AAJ0CL50_9HYPO|nr:hypothetical protein QQS21_007197 [Conoideocrella luteorostrata]